MYPAQEPSAAAEQSPDRKRPDAIRRACTDLNLLNREKAKVEQKLVAFPDDARTLRQMGDLQRKLGDFGAASETYRKLKAMDDDAVSAWCAWCICALNGEQLPASVPEEPHPTPFVRITDFLTGAQRAALLDTVKKEHEHFAPAQVRSKNQGGESGDEMDERVGSRVGRVDLDTRVALVAGRSVVRRIGPLFVKALGRVVDDVVRHFRVDAVDKHHVELNVIAHRDGDFFTPHQDTGYARSDSRLVSFAYYFHREPKGFAGGELLLYDTCIATGDYRAAAFSRIEPINNSLVFFPSDYCHEVLSVHAKSSAFENTRFAIVGWLHGPARKPSGARGRRGRAGNRSA